MYTHEFNIACMQAAERLLFREKLNPRKLLTVIPQKFIPSKYTRYTVHKTLLIFIKGV